MNNSTLVETSGKTHLTDEKILQYLSDGYWMVSKSFVKKVGLLPAFWLSHIIEKYQHFKKEGTLDERGFFYNVQGYIKKETTLTFNQQSEIIRQLKQLKILEVEKRGLPARNYYKINITFLIDLVTDDGGGTSQLPSKGLVTKKNRDIIKEIKKESNNKDLSSFIIKEDKDSASPTNPEISEVLVNVRRGRKALSSLTQEPTKKNRPTRESVQQPQRPGKYLHYEKASEEACSVINLWNAIDGTPNHRLTSKGVEKVLYHLDNGILQKHEPQQIERAIRDLVMMQYDPGLYNIPSKGKISIEDFFLGNGFLKKKGYFKQLIMPGGYKTFLKPLTDLNPESTEKIKKLYQKHILHQDNGATLFTPKQESQFITAARQLRQFMKGKRLEKCLGERTDETEYVMMLFEAIEEEFGKTNFNVGHLASNYTWNDIYPRFISRHWEAE